jgi:hypothetical protein
MEIGLREKVKCGAISVTLYQSKYWVRPQQQQQQYQQQQQLLI